MENEENRPEGDEQQKHEQTVEEYDREVEEDPSTAPSDNPQIEEIRGG